MDIAQEMFMTFNDDPDLLKKVITGDESCAWLWLWNQSPIIPMEASKGVKTENGTSSSVKWNEGFADCFLRLQRSGASRNTTLKLCTDYAKQFVRNAQNCWKTSSLAHILPHLYEFFIKNKTVIMSESLYSTDLVLADFFLLPKLKNWKTRWKEIVLLYLRR